jgi:transcriptional regulator with XRE-family HTH domain
MAHIIARPTPISPAARALGERVRARREALGLSQEALAHRSGVHWTFLGQVERGRRNLNLHNLLKISAGLGTDPAELVGGLLPPEHDGDRSG